MKTDILYNQLRRPNNGNNSSKKVSGNQPNRPHVCLQCGKGFTRRRELERHGVVHTGLKPFECPTCQKRFGRKDKLTQHRKTHLIAAVQQNGAGDPVDKATMAADKMINFSTALQNYQENHLLAVNPSPALAASTVAPLLTVDKFDADDDDDYSFKPNFYSQISIGGSGAAEPPQTDMLSGHLLKRIG